MFFDVQTENPQEFKSVTKFQNKMKTDEKFILFMFFLLISFIV